MNLVDLSGIQARVRAESTAYRIDGLGTVTDFLCFFRVEDHDDLMPIFNKHNTELTSIYGKIFFTQEQPLHVMDSL